MTRLDQKINYLRYRFLKKGEVLSYNPVTISIVATSRCTLSCDMCPTHSRLVPDDYPHKQKNVKDMDFAMFKEIIDRFKDATTVHIIGSGEPLLCRDFFRMVDYAASRNMIVKTFSNGTMIEENIDRILGSKLNGITISINGHDSKEFERMTGMDGAVYRKILTATRKLIEEKKKRGSGVKVKLSFIIDRDNYRQIPDMADLALSLGADHAFFCNFLPCPYERLSADERVLMDSARVRKELRRIFSAYPPQARRLLTPPVPVDKYTSRNMCRTHFSQIRFDGDGNVSSCSMMLLNMEGNGNYRDSDVWNNSFFRKMRRAFMSAADTLPGPCRTCPDNKGSHIIY